LIQVRKRTHGIKGACAPEVIGGSQHAPDCSLHARTHTPPFIAPQRKGRRSDLLQPRTLSFPPSPSAPLQAPIHVPYIEARRHLRREHSLREPCSLEVDRHPRGVVLGASRSLGRMASYQPQHHPLAQSGRRADVRHSVASLDSSWIITELARATNENVFSDTLSSPLSGTHRSAAPGSDYPSAEEVQLTRTRGY
jgi:hypothetical protein